MMDLKSKIYVSGGETLVGRAIVDELDQRGYGNVIGKPGEEPDLTDSVEVERFFSWAAPDYVFFVPGLSGRKNQKEKYPVDFLRENLLAGFNVLHQACRYGTKRLLYLAPTYRSSLPLRRAVEYLQRAGSPDLLDDAHALSAISAVEICRAYRRQYGADFICGIPALSFGPGDDFSEETSSWIPALLRGIHNAKEEGATSVVVCGSGCNGRQFIYSRDLAEACLLVMQGYKGAGPIDLAPGSEISPAELGSILNETTGFHGEIVFKGGESESVPPPRLDGSKLGELGWTPRTSCREAVKATYAAFLGSKRKRSHPSWDDRGCPAEIC